MSFRCPTSDRAVPHLCPTCLFLGNPQLTCLLTVLTDLPHLYPRALKETPVKERRCAGARGAQKTHTSLGKVVGQCVRWGKSLK
jgi:hypothetical protein